MTDGNLSFKNDNVLKNFMVTDLSPFSRAPENKMEFQVYSIKLSTTLYQSTVKRCYSKYEIRNNKLTTKNKLLF